MWDYCSTSSESQQVIGGAQTSQLVPHKQMGPALLPTPLSPAPFPANERLPRSCPTVHPTAVMHIEHPQVQWAPWVLRIVMLVASGLTGSGMNLRAAAASCLADLTVSRPAALACAATFARRFRAGVWSRQAVGWAPGELCLPPGGSNGPLHAAAPADCLSLRTALSAWALPVFPACLLPTFQPDPGTPFIPSGSRGACRQRRASRGICGSHKLAPKSLQGVFSDAAAGIAAIPIRFNFSVIFQAVKLE